MPAIDVRRRSTNRIAPLLDAAAGFFARKGYGDSTMREIAEAVDMLPGSVYYHFKSKERLLLAVYQEGVDRLCEHVDEAVDSCNGDPWKTLERALEAHLETVLDQSDYARVLIRVTPDTLPDIADDLSGLRAAYEKRFETLIKALKLPRSIDRSLLRLFLLGGANWAELWYQPERSSPAKIARSFIKMLKEPLDVSHLRKR